jgi:hypothetical protein
VILLVDIDRLCKPISQKSGTITWIELRINEVSTGNGRTEGFQSSQGKGVEMKDQKACELVELASHKS